MSRWDAILASAPLNREAAVVTGQGDESGYRKIQTDRYEQDGPHQLKRVPCTPQFVDLTRQKFGKLTVRGLCAVDTAKGQRQKCGTLWAVKCECGTYTAKRRKALQAERAVDDAPLSCTHCTRLFEIKQGRASAGNFPLKRGAA